MEEELQLDPEEQCRYEIALVVAYRFYRINKITASKEFANKMLYRLKKNTSEYLLDYIKKAT